MKPRSSARIHFSTTKNREFFSTPFSLRLCKTFIIIMLVCVCGRWINNYFLSILALNAFSFLYLLLFYRIYLVNAVIFILCFDFTNAVFFAFIILFQYEIYFYEIIMLAILNGMFVDYFTHVTIEVSRKREKIKIDIQQAMAEMLQELTPPIFCSFATGVVASFPMLFSTMIITKFFSTAVITGYCLSLGFSLFIMLPLQTYYSNFQQLSV